jgi:predicted molibdopterin-dependent oxidoreductase YjgC
MCKLERNSPQNREEVTGVPAAEVRGAARLYATAGNGAIYYGGKDLDELPLAAAALVTVAPAVALS